MSSTPVFTFDAGHHEGVAAQRTSLAYLSVMAALLVPTAIIM
jgi:hypothetical protein